ncbi:MAG TPA: T9SS type A sorting domain-containing protein [candidate division WOR-3 bacterium]|uniref:T9SS type A sorting domain-containing protein n=1 Tax=candidate division WOR-3 bacterium TaxID=2052148 RepID=A0A7C0XAI8_UNCW3|nr:T9SS type A sorting domain-containing protein [candidate division WOR-3 bacterium]
MRYYLGYPEPNPVRGRVVVEYSVPEDVEVRLGVYDVAGRRVRDLVKGRVKAGMHRLEWDRRDGRGRLLPSGVYFLRLEAGKFRETRKLLLLERGR